MQVAFFLDLSRCVACYSCVLACKSWHGLEPGAGPGDRGVEYRQVSTIECGDGPHIEIVHASLSCMHCEEPACLAVCPGGAISKRLEDGIVLVDRTRCTGCHACADACPFGVPQFDADGVMAKCDYCLDRIERGLEPACTATCPTGAIRAGSLDGLQAEYPNAHRLISPGKPCFLISK